MPPKRDTSPAETDPISLSLSDLRADLAVSIEAWKHFLNADFEEANRLQLHHPRYEHSMYLKLGVAFIAFVKCFFTFETPDIDEALMRLRATMRVTKRVIRSLKIAINSEEKRIFSWHADLVLNEVMVMRSLVRVVAEPDGMNVTTALKEILVLRRAYIYYREAEEKLAAPENARIHQDRDLVTGILLGNGMINMTFSMMPPSIFKLFAFIGYTGDGRMGLLQLKKAGNELGTLRGPICNVLLLAYYTVISSVLTSNTSATTEGFKERKAEAWNILQPCLKTFPESPIFLALLGRYYFLEHRTAEAIEAFERARVNSARSWPNFTLSIYWDLIMGHMRQLEYEPCISYAHQLARDSHWSRSVCTWLEVTFRDALARESTVAEAAELRAPIPALIEAIPKLQVRIAGRAFPMERHVAIRSELIMAGECELFLPEYELMSLWDSFAYMSEATLAKAESILQVHMIVQQEAGHPRWAMVRLCLAGVRRTQGKIKGHDGSLDLLHTIMRHQEGLAECKCFPQLIPLTHVELAASYLTSGEESLARSHWKAASKWKYKYYLERSIQARCSKLAAQFTRI